MTLSQAERTRMHLPPAVALDMYRRMHKIRQFDEIARALIYGLRGEVPEPEYLIPLGQADIKRAGSDVTVVAVGHLVHEALQAADQLAAEGISAEVVDPRTLYPLDVPSILASVHRTGRLVVADDGYRFCRFGSEVAAIAAERAFDALRAPVARVSRPQLPVPYSPPLLKEVTPAAAHVHAAVRRVVGRPVSVG